jgi:hypothetical protein
MRRNLVILVSLAIAVSLLALLCVQLHSFRLIEQLATGSP